MALISVLQNVIRMTTDNGFLITALITMGLLVLIT